MGVAPEATAKDLYLVVGSTPHAAIFSFYLPKFFNFSGARTALPMGVAPEAMNKYLYLVIGSRHFHLVLLDLFLFSKVAPEHLIKNLYFIKGSALFFRVAFYEAVESNFSSAKMTLLLTIATIASQKFATSLFSLPCGPN